jgi:hypothetical protein
MGQLTLKSNLKPAENSANNRIYLRLLMLCARIAEPTGRHLLAALLPVTFHHVSSGVTLK